MRLPADKVKEAILHADQDVREAAVVLFRRFVFLRPDHHAAGDPGHRKVRLRERLPGAFLS